MPRTASTSVTSAGSTSARRPSWPTSAATFSSASALRLLSATSAPARASATAIAAPIPREAPVTRAVFPVRSKLMAETLATGLPAGSRAVRRSRARQQAACQCRRSAASGSAAGQATTCGVAGRISWSQPGHRYGLVLAEPVSRRTTQSSPCHSSTDSTPTCPA